VGGTVGQWPGVPFYPIVEPDRVGGGWARREFAHRCDRRRRRYCPESEPVSVRMAMWGTGHLGERSDCVWQSSQPGITRSRERSPYHSCHQPLVVLFVAAKVTHSPYCRMNGIARSSVICAFGSLSRKNNLKADHPPGDDVKFLVAPVAMEYSLAVKNVELMVKFESASKE